MPSIVGTWNVYLTWSSGKSGGTELPVADHIFNADGTWTDRHGDHHGRWLQVGDQVVWNVNVSEYAGLVYSASIQPGHALPHEASMTGIMGHLVPYGRQGSFRAQRSFMPGEVVVAGGGVPEDNNDPLLGPVAGPVPGDSSDRADQGV
jgi:hypothetical protein